MFIAFIMKPMGDIDWVKTFETEQEADEFGREHSSYGELDPDDDPDHWAKYDPPVVILFEADDDSAVDNGKYKRPVAVYQRGEKHVCTKLMREN
jgi:hypothetical protein